MSDTQKNIAETIIEQAVGKPVIVNHDDYDAPILLYANGFNVDSMENFLKKPSRIKKNPAFSNPEGFVAYVSEFKNDSTYIIERIGFEKMIAAFIDGVKPNEPAWENHVASFAVSKSSEWGHLLDKSEQWMSQKEFAEFLDEHLLYYVTEPSAAELKTLIKQFKANVTVESVVELDDNGNEIKLEFSKRTTVSSGGKETVAFPNQIIIKIEPFRYVTSLLKDSNLPSAATLRLLLRYVVLDNNRVRFKYLIVGKEKVEDAIISNVIEAVIKQTGVERVYRGVTS